MGSILAFLASYIESNPQVVSTLITSVIGLFAKNPSLLHAVVATTVNKVAATVPTVVPLTVTQVESGTPQIQSAVTG
jgi:hypothetical protein